MKLIVAPRPALRLAATTLTARHPQPALSLATLLPAAAAVPPLAQDAACTLGVAVASLVWVKLLTGLAASGRIPSNLSRKLIHTSSGPFFLICWALFSELPEARLLAALVPSLQVAKLWLASRGRLGADGEEMVRGISRSGSTQEVAGGPLVYTLVLLAATLLGWRTLWAVVPVCQMAVGDGLADIVGRRYGTVKWPFAPSKSPAGSAAFVAGAHAASLGMVAFFHSCGYTPLGAQEALLPLLVISVISAAVELLPLGDDNLTVPLVSAALTVVWVNSAGAVS
eukprot:Transcript_27673.p1 GENE.Transcript_27673~~Transcript_27673.p1  ORF type:complete len:283 (-),score=84.97 Transcript_27673:205-1053(-)